MQTILIDRRNIDTELPRAIQAIQSADVIGLDCETHDDDRHAGLNLLMKVNEETRKKAGNTRLFFDMRRTTVCGFSVYPEGADAAWYVNLAHADVENRLTFEEVKPLLDARKPGAHWLCHNAPFELTVFRNSLKYELTNVICTMQLSVSCFGDDNYDKREFQFAGLGGLEKWAIPLFRAAAKGGPEAPEKVLTIQAIKDLRTLGLTELVDDLRPAYIAAMKRAHPDMGGSGAEEVTAAYTRLQEGPIWMEIEDGESSRRFNREVEEIIGKITAKTSDATGSYNGYVDELAYGHGLKQLVKRFFGYQMGTFKETLGDNAHMGQLTGDDVREYGAEDAYWVVPLFRTLLAKLVQESPNAVETFFTQENPMIYIYSDVWVGGMRVNHENIEARRQHERGEYANLLRSLRAALKACPDFPENPNSELLKREKWYANYQRYRDRVRAFRDGEDSEDDYTQCLQVKGSVSSAWADERGGKTSDFSVMHYMPIRTILYDLLGARLQFDMGKVASDGDARGKVRNWLEVNDPNPAKLAVLDCLTAMSGVETRMKLYLTPYVSLTDPETGYLYPTLSSLLNTRRLAASSPNVLALAKRGESTYVRGFFLGD